MDRRSKLAAEMTHWSPVQSQRPLADMLAGMNTAQKLGLLQIPLVSDVAGLLGDLQMYQEQPETRGLLNYGLTGVGLLPFVPGAIGHIGQAKAGGEIAKANGYFYKGGQFLPSTSAEPGKWKVSGKWVKSGKAQISPDEWANQPTPFSRSIYDLIGAYLERGDEGVKLRGGMRDALGNPVALTSGVRPGIKGVLGEQELTMQELIDAYNSGQRWFDVKPVANTMTTMEK